MSLSLTKSEPAKSKEGFHYVRWLVLFLIVTVIGGGGWYYFFGRKPKIAFTVPLKKDFEGGYSEGRTWPLAEGRILVFAGGEMKLCDLEARKEVWSAKVPVSAEVDPAWQNNINSRFVRLQQWAADLAQKRAALNTPQATKAFNAEVAKYQAELVAARTDAAKPAPPKPKSRYEDDDDGDSWPDELPQGVLAGAGTPAEKIAAAKMIATAAAAQTEAAQRIKFMLPKGEPAGDRIPTAIKLASETKPQPKAAPAPAKPRQEKLNTVVSVETQMLKGRIANRAKSLANMDRTIATKKAAAKTELAKADVQQWEAKRANLAAEQKTDEAALAKATGTPAPAAAAVAVAAKPAAPAPAAAKAAAAPSAPEPESDEAEGDDLSSDFGGEEMPAQAAVLGDRVWLIDGSHAVAFGLSDGAVKADLRLAGPAIRVFAHATSIHIVAEAGPQARQLTRIDPAGANTSLYVATPPSLPAFSGGGMNEPMKANIQARRVNFTGSGGSLARADIRLVERKTKVQQMVKASAEKALTDAVANSAGNSTDEALAIMKVTEMDNLRMSGQDKQEVDDSTYEVTLSRPFEAAVVPFTERLQGRVQVLSTPSLDLITAGTKLIAVDRANKKLWEATLGAAIPQRSGEADWESQPAVQLEKDGKLYFADGAFLTAIQIANGQVLWRLPSVGIRKVEMDADGDLYVQSDNLPVDSLTFLVGDDAHPATSVTLKVAADNGKIQWEAPKFQDVWVSGKDVYAFRETKNPADIENQVFDPGKVPEARVKFYKLSRSDGKPIWEWFQTRLPLHVIPHGKTVAILFRDELQVIHSIAL